MIHYCPFHTTPIGIPTGNAERSVFVVLPRPDENCFKLGWTSENKMVAHCATVGGAMRSQFDLLYFKPSLSIPNSSLILFTTLYCTMGASDPDAVLNPSNFASDIGLLQSWRAEWLRSPALPCLYLRSCRLQWKTTRSMRHGSLWVSSQRFASKLKDSSKSYLLSGFHPIGSETVARVSACLCTRGQPFATISCQIEDLERLAGPRTTWRLVYNSCK